MEATASHCALATAGISIDSLSSRSVRTVVVSAWAQAVEAQNGIVTVSGQVLTFYEKQLCNQCCRRVAGVLELVNAVDVTQDMRTAAMA